MANDRKRRRKANQNLFNTNWYGNHDYAVSDSGFVVKQNDWDRME